jgi:signal transduction histidine kinase/DNA-binding response OmpR family regulator
VKASNNDGIRNDAGVTLNIEILPPFYLTIWAFVLYFLLAVSLVLFLLRNFKKKVAGRHQLQMEKFENEKEKEVYKAKIDFFTNVAHEIRTPLTLIKGPLDSLLQKKEQVRDIEKELNIMSKNTSRLLNLTNQLLDFRKTETQGFRLIFTENNVTELLRESYLSFSSMAAQKGLDFTLEVPPTDLMAHLDKEAFIKIISNLFSNAVKYAGSYIRVRLEVDNSSDNQRMVLHVDNDGVLIPDSFRENIFQPFVRFNENDSQQLTTGTGIGLALSRSLAELHHGLLFMERIPDCNSFCLQLPVRQDEAILIKSQDEHWDPIFSPNTANSTPDKSRPVLLLVEDNPDMLAFVSMQLTDRYTLLSATNGVNALDMLDKYYVNLVISDIMMPQMDGFELCRKIKSTLAYSHIPVILLTARTNLQSKIEGMELGADAYIEKPFPVDYLQACVANLLQNREKLRETFTRSPFIASSTLAMTRADEDFLNKINEIISGNIANSDFSMDEMAEVLHMSRASFYRKIKETLDLNPSEYLRLERLKKAAVLLRERNNLVNEVCYMVGFNSPSYFSKCFLKQFGVLPKDFAAEGRKE